MKTFRMLCATLLFSPAAAIAGTISEAHPDVILCSFSAAGALPAGDAVLYVAGIGDDGSVVYQAQGMSPMTAVFDADGQLQGPSENVCGGMSLSDLEAAGKTRNY